MFIAITGTIGSGKNTLADYLESQGFAFVSGSNILSEELKRQHLPLTRENMHHLANKMRAETPFRMIDEIIDAVSFSDKAAVGYLRAPSTLHRLRERKPETVIIAVDAPVALRYQRITSRNEEKDRVTFEEFVAGEEKEMSSKDPHRQNVDYCMSQADVLIYNDGSLEDFYKKIDRALEAFS